MRPVVWHAAKPKIKKVPRQNLFDFSSTCTLIVVLTQSNNINAVLVGTIAPVAINMAVFLVFIFTVSKEASALVAMYPENWEDEQVSKAEEERDARDEDTGNNA